jgi:transcriptional regulator GlxA family with amidase domain
MARREVALVIYEGVQALDVAGPLDVFATANGFLAESDRYDCLLVAGSTDVLRTSNGMRMVADLSFEQAGRPFHTVLVAGERPCPTARPTKPCRHG